MVRIIICAPSASRGVLGAGVGAGAELATHEFVTSDADVAAAIFEQLRVASANAKVPEAGAAAAKSFTGGWAPNPSRGGGGGGGGLVPK